MQVPQAKLAQQAHLARVQQATLDLQGRRAQQERLDLQELLPIQAQQVLQEHKEYRAQLALLVLKVLLVRAEARLVQQDPQASQDLLQPVPPVPQDLPALLLVQLVTLVLLVLPVGQVPWAYKACRVRLVCRVFPV